MASVIRALTRIVLPTLAPDFGSVNALVKHVQAIGQGYRLQDLWRDASNAWYRAHAEERQEALDLSKPLTPRQYLRGDWRRKEAYYFYGEATWWDPVNEVYTTRPMSIYSNYDTTTSELMPLWESVKEKYLVELGYELVDIELFEKWHKIGSPYKTGLEL